MRQHNNPDLSHIYNLCHSLQQRWIPTHLARLGIKPSSSQRQCWVLNLLSHNEKRLSKSMLFFFFLAVPTAVKVPETEIEPALQQQPKLLQWQHQILSPLPHKGTPVNPFSFIYFNRLFPNPIREISRPIRSTWWSNYFISGHLVSIHSILFPGSYEVHSRKGLS